jgi:hypothetical protein
MVYTEPRTWPDELIVDGDDLNEQLSANMRAVAQKGLVYQIGAPGGDPIAPGIAGYIPIPADLRVYDWFLVADSSGSISIDIYRAPFADFPPSAGDSICGTEKPALSSQQSKRAVSIGTWDTDLDYGDVLAVNVDSADGVLVQATFALAFKPR